MIHFSQNFRMFRYLFCKSRQKYRGSNLFYAVWVWFQIICENCFHVAFESFLDYRACSVFRWLLWSGITYETFAFHMHLNLKAEVCSVECDESERLNSWTTVNHADLRVNIIQETFIVCSGLLSYIRTIFHGSEPGLWLNSQVCVCSQHWGALDQSEFLLKLWH